MNASNFLPEIWLLYINFEKFVSMNKECDQTLPSKCLPVIGHTLRL